MGEKARAKLEEELALINKLGMASYFLVVWDLVEFAREHAVEHIGEAGKNQCAEKPVFHLPESEHEQQRRDQDANRTDQVGNLEQVLPQAHAVAGFLAVVYDPAEYTCL